MPQIGFAVKAVVVREDKFLVIKKSDTEDVNPNTYDIPGGRLEYGEMPDECLRREVKEEASLEVEVIRPTRAWSFVKKEKQFQLVGVTFLCRYVSGEVALSDEHTGHEWINLDRVEDSNLPGWMKEEIRAAREVINLG